MDFTLIIVIVVLAIVADLFYVRWRAGRRPAQTQDPAALTPTTTPLEAAAPTIVETPSLDPLPIETTPAPETIIEPIATEAPQLRPSAASLPTGIVGLVLIFAAQAAVAAKQPLVGLGGFLIGSVLFVRGMHNQIPEAADVAAPSASGVGATTLNLRGLFVRPATPKPQPKPKPVTPLTPPPKGTPPSFWKYWRYYTVANLIKGTTPDIPQPPAPPVEAEPVIVETPAASPESVQPISSTLPDAPPALVTVTNLAMIEPPATVEAASTLMSVSVPNAPTEVIAPAHPATPPPAPVQPVPHSQTRLMVVTPLEEVLVVDVAHNAIFHFDAQGNLLQQFKADHLAATLTAGDITFSHDGSTAYVFNPDTASLQVYKLK